MSEVMPSSSIPHHFFCPITQDVMEDPVVCADGHSYERASVEILSHYTAEVRPAETAAPAPLPLPRWHAIGRPLAAAAEPSLAPAPLCPDGGTDYTGRDHVPNEVAYARSCLRHGRRGG